MFGQFLPRCQYADAYFRLFSWLACSQDTCFAAWWNQIQKSRYTCTVKYLHCIYKQSSQPWRITPLSPQVCSCNLWNDLRPIWQHLMASLKLHSKQVWSVIIFTGITQHLCGVCIRRPIEIWSKYLSHFGNRIRQTLYIKFLNAEKRQAGHSPNAHFSFLNTYIETLPFKTSIIWKLSLSL